MAPPLLLDQHGQPLPPSRRLAGFEAGSGRGPELSAWHPFNYSADAALLPDRESLSARVHDLARNDGWASGGLQKHLDNVIGSMFTLQADPDWRALGQDKAWADEWSDRVEGLWRGYAEDPDSYCDAARQRGMVGLIALLYRHRITDGEALAALLWLPERGGRYATTVQVLDPDRLSNPMDRADEEFLRGGVEIGEHGEPLAYHIRKGHPGDVLGFSTLANRYQWERIERETAFGRRMVIHDFEAERAGQTRGRSPLAPILKKLRMLGRYDEIEMQASVLNAVLAAFITSPFDHEALMEMLQGNQLDPYQTARAEYYAERRKTLPQGVQVGTLFPGEQVQFTESRHPNSVYSAFEAQALRNIATGMGLSYEQLAMDWSQTNYSSARAALLEVWKFFTARRGSFGEQTCRQIYVAWLEEAVDLGEVELPPGAPDFLAAKAAYTRCKWIGPGRGWVDPVKEAQGAVLRIKGGLSTLRRECGEQGLDWREVLEQLAREMTYAADLGLPPLVLADAMAIGGTGQPQPQQQESP